MVNRLLENRLHVAATRNPVITLTGPRQSGKTTLAKMAFPNYAYVSLEAPDERALAISDPRRFLARFNGPVILDEIQRVPDLFSYIQGRVDESGKTGEFVLTGSHNFLLLRGVSQSLAGRCAIFHLLPFSQAELQGRQSTLPEDPVGKVPEKKGTPSRSLEDTLYTGFYPAVHNRNIPPLEWMRGYVQTYLERDVRDIVNVGDIETFRRFVQLCAGRSGQLLNLSALASDAGITHPTARRWLSVLEAGFVVHLLRPYHRNFGKRLIRTPKLYFLDTGLLCFLLGIRTPEDLRIHAARGAVFETFVLAELVKSFENRGETPAVHFWRDSNGREVDFLVETGKGILLIEAKSGTTIAPDFFGGLAYWRSLAKDRSAPATLVYGGNTAFSREEAAVVPWHAL